MKKIRTIKKYCCIIALSIFTLTMFGCSNAKTENKKEVIASQQILNAKQYDKLVQVGNKVINLPAKYSDFVDAGAVLESKDLSEDLIIAAHSGKLCVMSIGNTKFELSIENNTDNSDSLKNADV